jgi:hypothetical protein
MRLCQLAPIYANPGHFLVGNSADVHGCLRSFLPILRDQKQCAVKLRWAGFSISAIDLLPTKVATVTFGRRYESAECGGTALLPLRFVLFGEETV